MDLVAKVTQKMLAEFQKGAALRFDFVPTDEMDDDAYWKIHKGVSGYVETLHEFEKADTFVYREDKEDRMTLIVGFGKHNLRPAMLNVIHKKAKGFAHEHGADMTAVVLFGG